MALILEIRDRRGTTTWHPLNGQAVTIGRGLSNDIILDDPYVDARHASIAHDDAGALTIRDLGSVNGVLIEGVRAHAPIPVQAGVELKIGRTMVRFRDRDEPVPPAFVEASYGVPKSARWMLSPRGSLLVVATLLGISALSTFLGSTGRSSGMDVFTTLIAALVVLTIWSSIWAVAVRGTDRRFHMRSHLAVAAAAGIVVVIYSTLNEWLIFFFPDVLVFPFLFSVMFLLALAGVVVGHLTVAGVLTQRLRWRVGLSVSGALLLLGLAGYALRDDDFSDVPRFPGQVKPISAGLVPTRSVNQFVEAIGDARSKADEAIKQAK